MYYVILLFLVIIMDCESAINIAQLYNSMCYAKASESITFSFRGQCFNMKFCVQMFYNLDLRKVHQL